MQAMRCNARIWLPGLLAYTAAEIVTAGCGGSNNGTFVYKVSCGCNIPAGAAVQITRDAVERRTGSELSAFLKTGTCVPTFEFYRYGGQHRWDGKELHLSAMDALVSVGKSAFESLIMIPASSSLIDLSQSFNLQQLEDRAFHSYSGTIKMLGPFPYLVFLGFNAFYAAGNPDDVVAIQCRGSPWSLGSLAFHSFTGKHDPTGEKCSCSDCSSTCASQCFTTTITTAAATTVTTTTGTTPSSLSVYIYIYLSLSLSLSSLFDLSPLSLSLSHCRRFTDI
jgi:hypothetical protein